MQTFLPYPDFTASAQALDYRRLGKQRVEAYQILRVLDGLTKGWRNHPAVLMWAGHEGALLQYVRDMITEAKHRGIKTENNEANINRIASPVWNTEKPEWMQDKAKLSKVVATHRANLYRKDPIFYEEYATAVSSEYNKPCCPDCLYFWPTHPRKKK
jgi:hypothetical protein